MSVYLNMSSLWFGQPRHVHKPMLPTNVKAQYVKGIVHAPTTEHSIENCKFGETKKRKQAGSKGARGLISLEKLSSEEEWRVFCWLKKTNNEYRSKSPTWGIPLVKVNNYSFVFHNLQTKYREVPSMFRNGQFSTWILSWCILTVSPHWFRRAEGQQTKHRHCVVVLKTPNDSIHCISRVGRFHSANLYYFAIHHHQAYLSLRCQQSKSFWFLWLPSFKSSDFWGGGGGSGVKVWWFCSIFCRTSRHTQMNES